MTFVCVVFCCFGRLFVLNSLPEFKVCVIVGPQSQPFCIGTLEHYYNLTVIILYSLSYESEEYIRRWYHIKIIQTYDSKTFRHLCLY